MEYFEQLLGIELGLPARFIIAFVVVMVLIALTATAIRGFSGSRDKEGGRARGGSNRRNRLHIGEWINLDDKRRLVLVRRDDVEHLLLIGGNSDLVVERDTAGVKPAAIAAIQTRPAPPDILEPPEQPKAPAIDMPYRSALRPAGTDTAVIPEATPPAAPGLRPSAAFGEMGARLQREVERSRGTPKPVSDGDAEQAASAETNCDEGALIDGVRDVVAKLGAR